MECRKAENGRKHRAIAESFGTYTKAQKRRLSAIALTAIKFADSTTVTIVIICAALGPKLRTWVRFPSPAPVTPFPSNNLAIGRGGKRRQ